MLHAVCLLRRVGGGNKIQRAMLVSGVSYVCAVLPHASAGLCIAHAQIQVVGLHVRRGYPKWCILEAPRQVAFRGFNESLLAVGSVHSILQHNASIGQYPPGFGPGSVVLPLAV